MKDWPETRKSEMAPPEFFPIYDGDWNELEIPNFARIITELFRENQQGSKITPSHPD